MKMIALKPIVCHTDEPIYSGRNHSGRLVKNTSSPPRPVITLLTTPFAENSIEMMLTIMTVERKYGA